MIKQAIIIFLTLNLVTGCASMHPGSEGKILTQEEHLPLKISAANLMNVKNNSFQLIEVTFENLSHQWLRIDQVEVLVGDPSVSHLSVVLGKDLQDWAKAMEFQQLLEQQNSEMVRLSLLAAGTLAIVAGSRNSSSSLSSVGAVVNSAVITAETVDEVKQSIHQAEQSEKIDSNHLYTPFSIPGRMFMRRWVLLNKPFDQKIDRLVL